MTPSGIEPATFRFVAQHLNHCATAVPCTDMDKFKFEGQLLVAIAQTDLHNFMEIRKLISQMKYADVRINMHSVSITHSVHEFR